jgi:hypothetical protein
MLVKDIGTSVANGSFALIVIALSGFNIFIAEGNS